MGTLSKANKSNDGVSAHVNILVEYLISLPEATRYEYLSRIIGYTVSIIVLLQMLDVLISSQGKDMVFFMNPALYRNNAA